MGYRYEVTVRPISDRNGPVAEGVALTFEVENKEDIIAIAERAQQRGDLNFGQNDSRAFAIGLKLFSEVMLKHRDNPIFAPLSGAFREFMMGLKRGGGGGRPGGGFRRG